MDARTFWQVIGVTILVALTLAAIVLTVAFRRLRRLRIPAGRRLLHYGPRRAPVTGGGARPARPGARLLSSPIIWVILNRFGLQSLRKVATVEALLPFTGPIPTLTLAWFAARFFNLGQPYDPSLIETERVGTGPLRAQAAG